MKKKPLSDYHVQIDPKRDDNLRYLSYKEKRSLRSLLEEAIDLLTASRKK